MPHVLGHVSGLMLYELGVAVDLPLQPICWCKRASASTSQRPTSNRPETYQRPTRDQPVVKGSSSEWTSSYQSIKLEKCPPPTVGGRSGTPSVTCSPRLASPLSATASISLPVVACRLLPVLGSYLDDTTCWMLLNRPVYGTCHHL